MASFVFCKSFIDLCVDPGCCAMVSVSDAYAILCVHNARQMCAFFVDRLSLIKLVAWFAMQTSFLHATNIARLRVFCV